MAKTHKKISLVGYPSAEVIDSPPDIPFDSETIKLKNPSLVSKLFQKFYVRNIKEIGYVDLDLTKSNNIHVNPKFVNPDPIYDDLAFAFIRETLTAGPGGTPLSTRNALVLTYCVRELGKSATYATITDNLTNYHSQLSPRGIKAYNDNAVPLPIILDSEFFARYQMYNAQDRSMFPLVLARSGNIQYLKYFNNFEEMMAKPSLYLLKDNKNFKEAFQPYQNDLITRLMINMLAVSKLFCDSNGKKILSNPRSVRFNPIDILNLLKITSLETKSNKNMNNILSQVYRTAEGFRDAQIYSQSEFLSRFCSSTFRNYKGALAIDWLAQPSPFSTTEHLYSNWDYIVQVLSKLDAYRGEISEYIDNHFESEMNLREFAFGFSRLNTATITRLNDTIRGLRKIYNSFTSKIVSDRVDQQVSTYHLAALETFLQEIIVAQYGTSSLDVFPRPNDNYLNGADQLTDRVLELLDTVEREFIAIFHDSSNSHYHNWIDQTSTTWLHSSLHLEGTYINLNSYIQSFNHHVSILKFVNYHVTTATGSYNIYARNDYELKTIKAWEPMHGCLNNMYADGTFNHFPKSHDLYVGTVYKLDEAYRFEIDSRGFMAENMGAGDVVSKDGRNRAEEYQSAASFHLTNRWAIIHTYYSQNDFTFYDDLIDTPDGTWHDHQVIIGKFTPLLREEWQSPIATAISAGKNLPTPMPFQDVVRYLTCNRPIVNDYPLASQEWKDAIGTSTYAEYFGISSLAALEIQERFGLNAQNANSMKPLLEIIDSSNNFNPGGDAFSENVDPSTRYFMEIWWWNYYVSNDEDLGRSFYDFLDYTPEGQL